MALATLTLALAAAAPVEKIFGINPRDILHSRPPAAAPPIPYKGTGCYEALTQPPEPPPHRRLRRRQHPPPPLPAAHRTTPAESAAPRGTSRCRTDTSRRRRTCAPTSAAPPTASTRSHLPSRAASSTAMLRSARRARTHTCHLYHKEYSRPPQWPTETPPRPSRHATKAEGAPWAGRPSRASLSRVHDTPGTRPQTNRRPQTDGTEGGLPRPHPSPSSPRASSATSRVATYAPSAVPAASGQARTEQPECFVAYAAKKAEKSGLPGR